MRFAAVRGGFGGANDAMTYAALVRENGWDVRYYRDHPLTEEQAPGVVHRSGQEWQPILEWAGGEVDARGESAGVIEPAELGYWWTRVLCEAHPRTYPLVWQNLPMADFHPEHTPIILHKAAGFIARSSMAAELLRWYGVEHERIHVIPPSVDMTRFAPGCDWTRAYDFEEQRAQVRVLFAGRPTPEKGILDVCHALAGLPSRLHARIELLLVGGADFDEATKRQLPFAVVSRGAVPHHAMPAVYQESDLFVYPTWPTLHWLEQWGLAVVEAMACGLPVITTDVGAFRELLPPSLVSTWTVPARDWVGLRDRLAALIENPSLRHTLGEINHQWCIEQYDGQKTASAYAEVLQ